MTINAHLIKKINLKIKNDELIIEKILEKNPSFNLNNKKLLEVFQNHEFDNTNSDLNGEIIIDKITWNKISNELQTKINTKNELEIIKKITKDLKNKEIIYYECF